MAEQETQRDFKTVDIVDFSMQGNPTRVNDAFGQLISDKVVDYLATKKQEVSANMFNPQEQTAEVEVQVAPEVEESTIDELSPELARKARDKAQAKRFSGKVGDKYHGQRQSDKFDAYAQRKDVEKKTGIKSPGDAMKYYRDHGRAPDGWGVTTDKGKPVKAFKK